MALVQAVNSLLLCLLIHGWLLRVEDRQLGVSTTGYAALAYLRLLRIELHLLDVEGLAEHVTRFSRARIVCFLAFTSRRLDIISGFLRTSNARLADHFDALKSNW